MTIETPGPRYLPRLAPSFEWYYDISYDTPGYIVLGIMYGGFIGRNSVVSKHVGITDDTEKSRADIIDEAERIALQWAPWNPEFDEVANEVLNSLAPPKE